MQDQDQAPSKRCFRCGVVKPLTDFYPHPRMADGHLNKCKECAKSDVRANRRSRPEQHSAYDQARARTEERRRKKVAYRREYRRRDPLKAKAHTAVGRAVRNGRLKRQPCEVCGDPNSEAHHDDYSRPLDVRWLCFKHHREGEHGQVVVAKQRPKPF